jgi:selenocysteine lyase/cysteine desulfurase
VSDFFGTNEREHVVIFGKNTTEAINKLSYRLFLNKDDVVLVSLLEHHSNDLPWRPRAAVKHIKVDILGALDENHFDELLKTYKGRVKLVAISGASNVTGHMPDIHRLAEKAHAAGAQILVDCAQLAPHRQISIGSLDDPAHLDYIAISAHKMYAPFGTGALIGRRDTFERGEPDQRGGGTIDVVTLEEVDWASPPDCDEAGSPNVVGVVALAASLEVLNRIGMATVAAHEAKLTAYALEKLNSIEGIKIYGGTDPHSSSLRLGVIPFNVKDLPHGLVAAVLGTEWGIGVRSGCFCAHPYVTHLLELPKKQLRDFRRDVRQGNRSTMPGFVRLSFGLYNTTEEIDKLAEALGNIAKGEFKGKYRQDIASGDFIAEGWSPKMSDYFSLSAD